MKGIIKSSTTAKKKVAVAVLSAVMLANVLSAATEKKPVTVTVEIDGNEAVYETLSSTVGDLFELEGASIKDNDYISYKDTVAVEDGMRIVVKSAKYVTVYDNGDTYAAISYGRTVEEVLKDFSHPLLEKDIAYPAAGELAYDGMEITVDRADVVEFSRGGSTIRSYTHAKTVGDFLKEIGVSISVNQKVTPAMDTILTNGMSISVTDRISPAVSKLDFGADLSKAKVLTCTATAYTASADETWPYTDGRTATGAICQVGMVAVDPKVIPLGSKLYIESEDGSYVYGYCTAEDTGGAIKGNKVDLVMNTKTECYNFGRRTVKVYVLS